MVIIEAHAPAHEDMRVGEIYGTWSSSLSQRGGHVAQSNASLVLYFFLVVVFASRCTSSVHHGLCVKPTKV